MVRPPALPQETRTPQVFFLNKNEYRFSFYIWTSHICKAEFILLQVREVVQIAKPSPSTVIARPVRQTPPTTFHDMRKFPEIIPVQEVIPEESAEDESSAALSEKGLNMIMKQI